MTENEKDITPENDEELHQRSGYAPGSSAYLNRVNMASYKQQSRGLWGGLALGAGLGAIGGTVIGVGAALLTGGWGLVLPVIATATVGSMLYFKDIFVLSGAAAGAVSAAMEIHEERHGGILSQGKEKSLSSDVSETEQSSIISKADIKKMGSGEKPYNGDEKFSLFGKKAHDEGEKPLFFWRVGAAGAAIGAAAGALASVMGGAMIESIEGFKWLSSLMADAGVAAGTEAMVLGGILTAGTTMLGASYGINRHYFREVFNYTNALYDGSMAEVEKQQEYSKAVDLGKEQEYEKTHSFMLTPGSTFIAGYDMTPIFYKQNSESPAVQQLQRQPIIQDNGWRALSSGDQSADKSFKIAGSNAQAEHSHTIH